MPTSFSGSPFDQYRHLTEDGHEYWSARELMKLLGYGDWRNFLGVIHEAREVCRIQAGNDEGVFVAIAKNPTQRGGRPSAEYDYHLTRHACYIVAESADGRKPEVALAKTYFAKQTRRAELADEAAQLSTDELVRIGLREQVRLGNRHLAATAQGAGVRTGQQFSEFQNAGYRGQYGGLTARAIAARKGLTGKRPQILDHMGATELAANWFRITQTDEQLAHLGVRRPEQANQLHHRIGAEVRQAVKQIGSTLPEELPAAPNIARLKRKSIDSPRVPALPAPKPARKRRAKGA